MAGPTLGLAPGVQDMFGVRALTYITPNTRVKVTTGFVGTVADQVLFAGAPGGSSIGMWISPNQRTLVGGTPSIGSSSVGTSVTVPPPPPFTAAPMLVVQGDSKVQAM